MAFSDTKGEHTEGGGTSTKGRKDGGQEAALKAKPVKDKITHLVKLYNAAREAAEDLSNGIKTVAEEAGCNAKVLRSFVVARAGESFEEKHREVEQLAFLFEKVGE
jgi:hypothetical protein